MSDVIEDLLPDEDLECEPFDALDGDPDEDDDEDEE